MLVSHTCYSKEILGRNGEISDVGSETFCCYFLCSFKTIEKPALLLIMDSGKLKSGCTIDVIDAYQNVNTCIENIQLMKENVDQSFLLFSSYTDETY